MSRKPRDRHLCPLFKKIINWPMCVEVQEVRNDNMDMDLFPEPFHTAEADTICEKCRWHYAPAKF